MTDNRKHMVELPENRPPGPLGIQLSLSYRLSLLSLLHSDKNKQKQCEGDPKVFPRCYGSLACGHPENMASLYVIWHRDSNGLRT